MAQTFHCPNWGAPLEYDGHHLTVECPFCGSSVVVPESLRPKEPAQSDEIIVIAASYESRNCSGGADIT
jgi:uncharacterized Zn finger protein (UPF0148 family)